jgi:hypothetical protein
VSVRSEGKGTADQDNGVAERWRFAKADIQGTGHGEACGSAVHGSRSSQVRLRTRRDVAD